MPTRTSSGTAGPPRRRDPERGERILEAAARLAAGRGFHAVGMAEIGAEAGIVGSGIYRHFASKEAVLLALLDRGMARLEASAAAALAAGTPERETLTVLVADHIRLVTENRTEFAVYYGEVHTLPAEARRDLRRRQRHHVEDWVHVLTPLRPDLSDGELRVLVHACVGAIQSTLFFRSGLDQHRLVGLLGGLAHGLLGVDPVHR
ncbi:MULTISPECIES: TetR/AcrR family transcriptional regulator [Pseudonocardia]|uniref:TetR family transcriptional regulator n=1 Tax=Pseudonocardia alni TaxID=33907 RepID=A0AA44USR3_PSEA5|nr:TetR/AcrR family transcriptional regulator [Pseudonocardia alni]OJG06873.1 HTH-type transcriptional repressor KstR2 [Pseudonocardia autotrophica]PKB32847.1 TetR family transcriptional regulator [Pseudonocardia alni]